MELYTANDDRRRTDTAGRIVACVLVGAFVAAAAGCRGGASSATEPGKSSEAAQEEAPEPEEEGMDRCAPDVAPAFEDAPDAVCARKAEVHAPDLLAAAEEADAPAAEASPAASRGPLALRVRAAANRPSCSGGAGTGLSTCGPDATDDCCRVAPVPAGRAGRIRITTPFDLGVYEVTVARFEAFVNAVGGDVRAAAVAGKLPGFDTTLASNLPASRAEVDIELGPGCKARSDPRNYGARTWPSADVESAVKELVSGTDPRAVDIRADATAARLRAKPVSCVSYYMAAAFCAWDGGRLPTNDEWVYTALGGSEMREYPWGSGREPSRLVSLFDKYRYSYPEDFPWGGNGQNAYHIAPPGRKPAGVGRFGHLDLGGNLLEWMANRTGAGLGIVRGGSWEGHTDRNDEAYVNYPFARTYGSLGVRCAYGAPAPPPPPAAPADAVLVPVYRSFNAAAIDHLLTRTQGEGAPAWRDEGRAFRLLASADPASSGDAPLYRCRARGSALHFASNDPACEGQVTEALLGYVFRRPVTGSAPLYRCYNGGTDHLTTLTPQECQRVGYSIEGTQGYASL